ncbi:MAG: hypothetical protein ABMA02_18245 [Saprospiraceae bacterium]
MDKDRLWLVSRVFQAKLPLRRFGRGKTFFSTKPPQLFAQHRAIRLRFFAQKNAPQIHTDFPFRLKNLCESVKTCGAFFCV